MGLHKILVCMRMLTHIHAKLGDLWWYTILLFIAQRFSDVINMFVGLWLVPKYVPMEELGAVLPITGFVGVLALPLTIASTPFLKFLTLFTEHGETGKAKSLVRDVFVGTGILSFGTFLLALVILPLLFERLRVASGSLGFLMVAVAILGASATVFGDAVRGLKLYGTTVGLQFLAAPFRLLLMIVFMPFRPLSGYVVGQGAAPSIGIAGALWRLHRYFSGCNAPRAPYWRTHGTDILRYTWPFAAWTVALSISGSLDTLVIRHRLSDYESAGYYMITRFSDIASYLGCSFAMFIFPMVAGHVKKDRKSLSVLVQSILGTFGGGLFFTMLLAWFGHGLLGLQSTWCPYQSLAGHMTLCAVISTLSAVVNCLTLFEIAQGRFRFMWYVVPVLLVKSLGLYVLEGYAFFASVLPTGCIDAIQDFNPARLDFVLQVQLIAQGMILVCLCADVFGNKREKESV